MKEGKKTKQQKRFDRGGISRNEAKRRAELSSSQQDPTTPSPSINHKGTSQETKLSAKKTKPRSVGFADDRNETREFELEEGEELKKKRYPTKKSADADIPLEKTSVSTLSPEEEFAQFKANFQEQSSRIYMVNHMVKRDQENLREEAQGKEMLHDMVSNDEGAYQAAPIRNTENVEATLKEDALEKMLISSLDKEFSKLKNKEMAQAYYDEKKANMLGHIQKMDKTLAPKIDKIIEKAEENHPIDELYDSNEVKEKKQKKVTQEVYNEFDKLMSKRNKKSLRFAEKDAIATHEIPSGNAFIHKKNPRGMGHEDKSARAVDNTGATHEPPKYSKDKTLDKDVELEKFMTGFVQNSAKEFLECHLDGDKSFLSDSCEAFLKQEFKQVSEANKEYIEPYYNEMKQNIDKHIANMEQNLSPKIDKMVESVKSSTLRDSNLTKVENDNIFKETLNKKFNAETEKDNKTYKSLSASFYKKLSKLCETLHMNKFADSFMKKSQKIKLEAMKTTLLSSEVRASGTARSSEKQMQKGVRQQ